MVIKESIGRKIFNIFNVTIMVALIIVTLYPMLYVVFASLSDASSLIAHEGFLLKPLGVNISAYKMLFKNPMILKGYGNTIFVVGAGVCINLTLTSLAAYVLSRKNVFFNPIFTKFIVFTMFFSGGLIPLYFTVRNVGLYNSLWALILPSAISTYNLIIMRTSFKAIPDSMEESATIDGANHMVILFKIIIPLSLPVIAVMILYYGVAHWNSWFNAMVFLKDRELYPLQLVLREIIVQNDTTSMTMGADVGDQHAISETVRYAVIVVATLPILMLYPFLQKYFVKGVMIGALKG
jgi:putative aldouronate transport system permease protein